MDDKVLGGHIRSKLNKITDKLRVDFFVILAFWTIEMIIFYMNNRVGSIFVLNGFVVIPMEYLVLAHPYIKSKNTTNTIYYIQLNNLFFNT